MSPYLSRHGRRAIQLTLSCLLLSMTVASLSGCLGNVRAVAARGVNAASLEGQISIAIGVHYTDRFRSYVEPKGVFGFYVGESSVRSFDCRGSKVCGRAAYGSTRRSTRCCS